MTLMLPQISRQNAFGTLRIFCCAIVITMHILDLSHTESVLRPLFDGHAAVCVFFFLSGFWVTRSFLSSSNLKNYLKKRAKRILPLYYISIGGGLLAFACASKLSLKEFFLNAETWKYLFWNCIFLNFMQPTLPGCFGDKFVAVNGALWTIKIEIAFYILLPILMSCLKKLKSLLQVNVTLFVLYILSVLYTFAMQKYASVFHLPSQFANQFPAFVSCFVCGIFCLFNWEWILQKLNLLIFPSVLLFVLHYITKTEFLMPASLGIICIFFAMRLSFLSSIIGETDFSYPLYLFHFPLIQLMVQFDFFLNSFQLGFFLTFAGTFLISVFAMKLISGIGNISEWKKSAD